MIHAPLHDEATESPIYAARRIARELHREMPMASIPQLVAEGFARARGALSPVTIEAAILETYGE